MSATPLDSGSSPKETPFDEEVTSLSTCRAFIAALPAICRHYKVEVGLIFQSNGDGVGVGFSMPPKTPRHVVDAIGHEVVRRMKITERLLEIEAIVGEFKRVGVDVAEIDRLVDEGNALAATLHPSHGPTDL